MKKPHSLQSSARQREGFMSTSNLSIGELEAKYPLYCKALKLLIKQEKTSAELERTPQAPARRPSYGRIADARTDYLPSQGCLTRRERSPPQKPRAFVTPQQVVRFDRNGLTVIVACCPRYIERPAG